MRRTPPARSPGPSLPSARQYRDHSPSRRRGAQRATDALLEAGVLELVELVPAAEPRVDRRLLLRVLDRDRPLDDPREGGLEPAEGLAERAVGASDAAGLGPALDVDDALV